ncbi:MAG: hypothetical protein ACLR0N_14250 [Bilophila wadsworthia]
MTHDSTFRLNGTVRLLHEGVHSERPPHDRLADPFPADHAASSALWNGLPEAAFTMPGTSTACPYLEQFFTAPVSQTENTPETASVPAPVYLCGSATSSMDVAGPRRTRAASRLGGVLALSQRSDRGSSGATGFRQKATSTRRSACPRATRYGHGRGPAVGGLIAKR